MRFSLRTALAIFVVLAFCCAVVLRIERHRLWRDTIFHCSDSGVIQLYSGKRFKTNQWYNCDKNLDNLSLLLSETKGEYLIVEDENLDEPATILVRGRRHLAVVTSHTSHSRGIDEYQIRIGKVVKSDREP